MECSISTQNYAKSKANWKHACILYACSVDFPPQPVAKTLLFNCLRTYSKSTFVTGKSQPRLVLELKFKAKVNTKQNRFFGYWTPYSKMMSSCPTHHKRKPVSSNGRVIHTSKAIPLSVKHTMMVSSPNTCLYLSWTVCTAFQCSVHYILLHALT